MNTKNIIPTPKTKFLKVRCPGCSNKQIIFSAASTVVRCIVCNAELAKPGASKAKLKATIVEVLP